MKRHLILLAGLVLASCDETDSAIQAAVQERLAVAEGARFGSVVNGVAGGVEYACVTVDARNRIGVYSGPQQVPVIKDQQGRWQALDPQENQSSESCTRMLAEDLSGANDSLPPSSYRQDPPEALKEVSTPFERAEVRWSDSYGDNVIQGTASLKSRSGKRYVCSSDSDAISLIPVSRYARERMKLIYGSDIAGFRGTDPGLAPGDPLYLKMMKETACDKDGRFIFQGLPDGEYFLVAAISWTTYKRPPASSLQGGVLMKRVSATGGEVKRVSLDAR